MLSAVKPPYLLKVFYHMLMMLALGAKFVVYACFLKITISTGVTRTAIAKLEAKDASNTLTN